MAESEEERKSLLMKVKEESEKAGLKLNIQKQRSLASGPITSWQIDEEIVETVTDFILGGSLLAQRLKRLPGMWETWVRSLGQGRSPGERNGKPLQYSCLENSMDRGAWQVCNPGLQ